MLRESFKNPSRCHLVWISTQNGENLDQSRPNPIALYILLTLRATRCILNRKSTLISGEWTIGLTSKVSFRDTLEQDFANAGGNLQVDVIRGALICFH